MIPNQRFSMRDSDGKRWDYGLDMYDGYFLMDATFMTSDIDEGESYTTARTTYFSHVVSRGVIMEKLTAIGAPPEHISAIGSDLPFPEVE